MDRGTNNVVILDIAMCPNAICPLRKECFRHPDSGTKPSKYHQSWTTFKGKNKECDGWMPIKGNNIKND